jgi:hypothetical protein
MASSDARPINRKLYTRPRGKDLPLAKQPVGSSKVTCCGQTCVQAPQTTVSVTFGLDALIHVTAVPRCVRSCALQFSCRAEATNGLNAARWRALAGAPRHTRVAGNRVRGAQRLVFHYQVVTVVCSRAVTPRPVIWERRAASADGSSPCSQKPANCTPHLTN